MNNKILLTAIIAAFAATGCQKQDDAAAQPPAAVPGPAGAPGPAGPQGAPGPAGPAASSGTNYMPPPAPTPGPVQTASADPSQYATSDYVDEAPLPPSDVGVNVTSYPNLVPVPGYPVYYAPSVNSNYFFYDGMYWVYNNDSWYASSWYNGPWNIVGAMAVPLFVLRVPVQYYRSPPSYFSSYQRNQPPQWGQHWGNAWASRRSGWDNWDHKSPPPAPLPVYQKQYSGNRYPVIQQQITINNQNYHYQPKDTAVAHVQEAHVQGAQHPPAAQQHGLPEERREPGQRPGTPPGATQRPGEPPQRPGEPPQRPGAAPQQQHEAPGHPAPAVVTNPGAHPGEEKRTEPPRPPTAMKPQENRPPENREAPGREAPKAMTPQPPKAMTPQPKEAPREAPKPAPQQHEAPKPAPVQHEAPKPPPPQQHEAPRPAPPPQQHEAPKPPPHEAPKEEKKPEEKH
jgi:hypothetical protein